MCSSLSSASTDPYAYFGDLQTARDLIAAYPARSGNDYTASLLDAILDSGGVIGRSGLKNVLDDITHSDLAALAEHYMTSIYFPRLSPHPPFVETVTTNTAQSKLEAAPLQCYLPLDLVGLTMSRESQARLNLKSAISGG